MNAQYKMTGLLIAALITSPVALAETTSAKPVTRIDFNKMIDANANDQQNLQKTVTHKMEVDTLTSARVISDKSKVVDFVDVEIGLVDDREIGLGEDRPIVDRRFNSVSEPRMAHEFEMRLVDQKKNSAKGS